MVTATGGFIETADTAQDRAPLRRTQIQQFLPSKGKFTFPAPYNTEAFRLTNADDCGGENCVNYVGYSYWPTINYHEGQDEMLIFVGMNPSRGGGGPSIIRFNKETEEFTDPQPIWSENQGAYWNSGQMMYWSLSDPHTMYYPYERSFYRVNVLTGDIETVFTMDGGDKVTQAHSSADGKVHAMTWTASNYSRKGVVVYFEETGEIRKFPMSGVDECAVDKSGKYLMVLAQIDGQQGEDNLIVDLETGDEWLVVDPEGAAGHADRGYGYSVHHDNWANDPGTLVLMEFDRKKITKVMEGTDWYSWEYTHLSHCNARPDLPFEKQVVFGSAAQDNGTPWANEVVAFKLDTSMELMVIAPSMTRLSRGDSYGHQPKGNCDYTGRYFVWTSNMDTNRLDLFMVKVPLEKLVGEVTTPIPTPDPSEPTPTPSTTVSAEETPTPTASTTASAGPTPTPSAAIEDINDILTNAEVRRLERELRIVNNRYNSDAKRISQVRELHNMLKNDTAKRERLAKVIADNLLELLEARLLEHIQQHESDHVSIDDLRELLKLFQEAKRNL